jgi:hypothetical protein
VVVHKEEVMKDIKCWHCGKAWDNLPMTRPLMTDQDRALDFAFRATQLLQQRDALAVVVKELAAAAKLVAIFPDQVKLQDLVESFVMLGNDAQQAIKEMNHV